MGRLEGMSMKALMPCFLGVIRCVATINKLLEDHFMGLQL